MGTPKIFFKFSHQNPKMEGKELKRTRIIDFCTDFRRDTMKKGICILLALLLLFGTVGCSKSKLLSPKDPVTLTMWHVYGEQADSPMNRLIQEFNETVGLQEGVLINVTALSNSSNIGPMLREAYANAPGAPEMPDLFFCHTNNAQELGAEALLDWSELFSEEELSEYVDDFVEEGMLEDRLVVFPVSKSTHMLFINGTQFARFSQDTGIGYEDLATWEGFFAAAEAFYDWSGGKTFCAFDYLLRSVELNAMSLGDTTYMTQEGWYDFSDPAWKDSWMLFARALTKGHIMVSDLYSNTQVMTGEVIAGMGSSAAILYYNDTVTYPDNTSEPTDLQVLPMPKPAQGQALTTQAGVGLCALKTTDQKAEAAALFARWLTQEERNLNFVTDTGYMPVKKGAFAAIDDHAFSDQGYANLYAALQQVQASYTLVKEPNYVGYYDKVYTFYGMLREKKEEWQQRSENGEDISALMEETWQIFQSIG